jgi:hypothetical protein
MDVRSTGRIVLDDGGSDFSRRTRCEAYHVEKTIRAVDCPGVRCQTVSDGPVTSDELEHLHRTRARVLSKESSLSLSSI